MLFGFDVFDLTLFVGISILICITVCALAMEAAVLFVPAFIFLFPRIVEGFPAVSPNEAIGLAITVEFFGYTSSVTGYWLRRQVDFRLGLRLLAITIPAAVVARVASFFVPEQGLLILFAFVLLGLAGVLYRSYRGDVRHTCLLCGDSIAAMRMGDEGAAKPGIPGESVLAPALEPALAMASTPAATVAGGGSGPAPGAAAARKKPYPNLGRSIRFNVTDRLIMTVAGLFAGVIGVAIGEISNTFLSIRKRAPIKVATGTAALVLHLTILSALGANLVVLFGDIELVDVQEIVIPWRIAFILAPVVVVGGQIGSLINSRLSDRALARAMMTAYVLVGLFVLYGVASG